MALERLGMCEGNPAPSSEAQVAASNAVLAAIAAGDALCGHAFGERSADQDHRTASEMVKRVRPDGPSLAAKLGRLLSDKSILTYGTFCTRVTAERAVRDAEAVVAALEARGL